MSFPKSFLWGASTSAHQTEGGNLNSDWWARENAPGSSAQERSNDAADSYHRYAEDMKLLADAGLNAYRFSIEWARIEPERDLVSYGQLEHYRRMIATARMLGLEPIVTLHHMTNPRWFAEGGGWRAADAVDRFVRYVEQVASILDGVNLVCTINEPNLSATLASHDDFVSLLAGELPLADPAISQTMLDAHRAACDVLRPLGKRVGWSVATQAFQAEPGAEAFMAEYAYPREDFFLEAARGDDWLGVQAYTRTRIGPAGPLPVPDHAEKTMVGWEYYPACVEHGIRKAWQVAGPIPVYVTENGIATSDDARRIDFMRDAIAGVRATLLDGIDVRAYMHWSALDNYEWGSYTPTFGLIAYDRKTFTRNPKRSLNWLGSVAESNRLP